jgi:hypothetical protein
MTTVEIMFAKLRERIQKELQYFLDNPEKVDAESITGAVARCYGALTLTTDVLFDLGQNELATELGQLWAETSRPAFYEILYKSWGC